MTGKRDPVDVFLYVLCKYLRDRGSMVLGMASATGQRTLLISLYGLWRRHEFEETGYHKFMDVVEEILSRREYVERLRRFGILEFKEVGGEPHVLVDVEKIRSLDCKKVLSSKE